MQKCICINRGKKPDTDILINGLNNVWLIIFIQKLQYVNII